MLRILTLNFWNINSPLEERSANFLEYLRNQKFDAILLQELSVGDGNDFLVEGLKRQGFNVELFETGDFNGRLEGIAIAVSNRYDSAVRLSLPSAKDDMSRGCLAARLVHDSQPVLLATTHLAYRPEHRSVRRDQISAIGEWLCEISSENDAVVLGGDFNVHGSESVEGVLRSSGIDLRDAATELGQEAITFSSQNKFMNLGLWPDRRLDRLLGNGLAQPVCSDVVLALDESSDPVVSDHYGVVAEFALGS